MRRLWIPILVLGAVLAGCGDGSGDKEESATRQVAPAMSPSDEAQMMREAQEHRKRFMGSGKGKYTPQSADGS